MSMKKMVLAAATAALGSSAAAVLAHHADAVRVVDHHAGAGLAGELHDFRQIDEVAGHGEDAVGDDELAVAAIVQVEEAVEVLHVVVLELPHLPVGEPAAFENGGVVFPVAVENVVLADDRGDGALIGLEAGGEGQCRFPSHELREARFQLLVEGESAVQESRTGTPAAEAARGLDGGLFHPGILHEAEVVVRPHHDEGPAVDLHLGAPVLGDRKEVRIVAGLFVIPGAGEAMALVEQTQGSVPREIVGGIRLLGLLYFDGLIAHKHRKPLFDEGIRQLRTHPSAPNRPTLATPQ